VTELGFRARVDAICTPRKSAIAEISGRRDSVITREQLLAVSRTSIVHQGQSPERRIPVANP
jgi:hypothetical protein